MWFLRQLPLTLFMVFLLLLSLSLCLKSKPHQRTVHRLKTIQQPGLSQRFFYDSAGRLARIEDSDGITTVYTYNVFSVVTVSSDLAGLLHDTLSYQLNEKGLAVSKQHRGFPGTSVTYVYDAEGRLWKEEEKNEAMQMEIRYYRSPSGQTDSVITRFTVDGWIRIHKSIFLHTASTINTIGNNSKGIFFLGKDDPFLPATGLSYYTDQAGSIDEWKHQYISGSNGRVIKAIRTDYSNTADSTFYTYSD